MARSLALPVRGALAAILALAALPSPAQTTSGSVSGSVRDAQGAAVPGAAVTLTSVRRGTTLATASDGSGDFVFPALQPDEYVLRVTAPSFKPLERQRLVVNANDRLTVGALTLEMGALSEELVVRADPPALQVGSAERSYAVEGSTIQNIAVNGRGFVGLASIAPGIVATGGDLSNITANGQRTNSNNLTIDGITSVDTGNNGGPLGLLSLDSIEEFKVLTSNYQAEYGRAAGAQISVVTKSGGRDFHGAGYWFHRGDGLNANTWLNNRSVPAAPVPKVHQNDVGYNLGGPVVIPGVFNESRSKLFFFLHQEFHRRLDANNPNRVRVPTALERQGDFSQTRDNAGNLFPYIRDYTTGLPCGAADTRGCFQDGGVLGRIPRSRLYQPGLGILNMFPASNTDGTNFNYITEESTNLPSREELLRLDWFPSASWRVTGRVNHGHDDRTLPYGSFVLGTNLPDFAARFVVPTRGYAVTVAGPINSNTFFEATTGSAHNSIDITPAREDFTMSALGLSGLPSLYPDAVQGQMPPQFAFGGRVANGPNIGSNIAPFTNFNTTYDNVVSLTKVWSRHTAKAGIYFHYSKKDQSSRASHNGTINFDNNVNNPYDSGFPYANAALGIYNSYTQASNFIIGQFRYSNLEWFAQDNWKVNGRLTLDYGLRFALIQPQYDAGGNTANFLPDRFRPAAAPRLYYPGRDAAGNLVAVDRVTGQTLPSVNVGRIVPGSGDLLNGVARAGEGVPKGLTENRGVHFGPRFGFTFDPSGNQRLILRGGGGVFYDRPQGNVVFDQIHNPPAIVQPTLSYGLLRELDGRNGLLAPPGLVALDPEGKVPTVYAFNLGFQVKVPFASTLDVSYVGAVSSHLVNKRNLNAIPYGATFLAQNQNPTVAPSTVPGASSLPANFLRPYPGYADIILWEFAASSNYHSLQTSLNRRFRDGLLVGLNYTWSKALGTVSDDQVFARIDENQRLANYGPMNFDRRHNFVANFVWEVPKTRAGGVLGGLLNDWQVSGLYQWQSGTPYDVAFSIPGIGNANLTGSFTEPSRTAIVGYPGSGHSDDPYRQFNTSAFTTPKPGSLGLESGRNYLTRAPIDNLNLSVAKSFRAGGQRRLELRLDAFNALNHTQFNAVNNTLSVRSLTDPTPTNLPYDAAGNLVNPFGFGAVTSVRAPRVIQIMARVEF
ncbi:MAG TPA: carboxypeptidase regulatory-like domain-containing protein [Vicinamibacteria bacterium]